MANLLGKWVTVIFLITYCYATPAADLGSNYPARSIRFVVTYPPGGGTDLVARQVGQKLAEAWG